MGAGPVRVGVGVGDGVVAVGVAAPVGCWVVAATAALPRLPLLLAGPAPPPAEHAAVPAMAHASTAAAAALIGLLIGGRERQPMYFWTRVPRLGSAASMFLAAPPRTALYALTTVARWESRAIRSVTDSSASATSFPRLAR